MSAADLEKLVVRLEAVAGRLESVASRGGSGGSAGSSGDDDPLWLDDYHTMHNGSLTSFVNATIALGGDSAEQGKLVRNAFDAHLNLLKVAAANGRPNAGDLTALLKPLSGAITAVQDFREKNRKSKQFNHLSAISEGIPFLGWVAVAPKPAAYIVQMHESAQFYTNKVLKEFRQSDAKQADWATSFIKLLQEVSAYVKDNHGTGLMWNKEKPAATAGSGPPGAGPPPPPPPSAGAPPPPPPVQAPTASSGGEDSKGALFASLNKGASVTQGLKKVTDDMKTHKNPNLRSSSTVPAKSTALSPRPYEAPKYKKFNAPETKKPPVFELQMKKWIIEHQDGNQTMVIENTSDKQTIYMYKCKNSVLQVKGKVNSITLDNCQKCAVVFEDLISTCEFVNCQSVKAQANGKVPTISIDKTDGAQLFLNEKSLNAQMITAKSSEMNCCITSPDGDITEFPVPEQFKTLWDGKKFATTTMDLNL